MNAKELRIGNLVADASDSSNLRIIEDKDFYSVHHPIDGVYNLNNVKGVSLTRDWLVKLGFILGNTPVGFDMLYHRDNFPFYVHPSTLQPLNDEGVAIADIRIEYVHQLQNLYFAITGKELIIT